jgi:hypothetical protein
MPHEANATLIIALAIQHCPGLERRVLGRSLRRDKRRADRLRRIIRVMEQGPPTPYAGSRQFSRICALEREHASEIGPVRAALRLYRRFPVFDRTKGA